MHLHAQLLAAAAMHEINALNPLPSQCRTFNLLRCSSIISFSLDSAPFLDEQSDTPNRPCPRLHDSPSNCHRRSGICRSHTLPPTHTTHSSRKVPFQINPKYSTSFFTSHSPPLRPITAFGSAANASNNPTSSLPPPPPSASSLGPKCSPSQTPSAQPSQTGHRAFSPFHLQLRAIS